MRLVQRTGARGAAFAGRAPWSRDCLSPSYKYRRSVSLPNSLLDQLSEIDEAVAQRVNHAVTGAKTIDLQPVRERSSQAYAEMSEAFSSLVKEYSSAPLQVDMHAPCSGTLSAGVLADVSRLGEYLMRLGCEQSLKTFPESLHRALRRPRETGAASGTRRGREPGARKRRRSGSCRRRSLRGHGMDYSRVYYADTLRSGRKR